MFLPDPIQPQDDCAVNGSINPEFHDLEETEPPVGCDHDAPLFSDDEEEE